MHGLGWCPFMLHVWAGSTSCYLELLDKLQKRICWTFCPSIATSLELLARHQNVASLSPFCRYYFGRCTSELAQLVQLPFSRGRSTRYSDRLHNFSVTFPRSYKMSMSTVYFLVQLDQALEFSAYKCFPLSNDLNGFKPRINRHITCSCCSASHDVNPN